MNWSGSPNPDSYRDRKTESPEDGMNDVQEKLSYIKKSTKKVLHAYRGR